MKKICLLLLVGISLSFRVFDNTAQTLPFSQNWTNPGLITANDNWSGVPGIEGYLGQDITTATGTDPQTLLTTSGVGSDLDVIANQTATSITNGGVAEFDVLPNPTIALQGSGTADAPYIILYLNTTGMTSIPVQYNLRDIDATADNAVQPVALQYRIGNAGNFTNIPAGFVADATTGPSLATLVTAVNITLPAACDNQPLVQLRIMTTNAVGNDEWVGVDDIQIGGAAPGTIAPTAGVNAAEAPVPTNGNFTISFTPVTPGPTTFNYTLNTGTATFNTDYSVTLSGGASPSPLVAATGTINVPGGTTSITVTITPIDDGLSEGNETVILALSAPSAGYVISPASATINISDDDLATTLIHDIQGTGTTATPGNFRIEGIVTGVYPTLSPAGFYMQEEDIDADANVNSSEGIFVVSNAAVNAGDFVRVIGTVLEGAASPSFNQAVIHTASVNVLSTGNPLPTVQIIFLPVFTLNDYERSEGMMVRFNGPFTVTNNENLGSFGEVSLSAGGLVYQPTQIVDPNDNPPAGNNSSGNSNAAAVTALTNSNTLRTILLDDGRGITPAILPYVDVDNTLRVGSTINVVPGILGFAFSQWRIQPMNGALPVFTHAVRPAVPAAGGNLKIVSFNVLNYFNGNGAGGGFPTARGAHSAAEFSRQRNKILNALQQMNGDVVGLIEMENQDLNDATPALVDLVNGLNGLMGAGTYAFIDDDLDNNGSQDNNTDLIRCAIIYKPAVVTPVGAAMIGVNAVNDRPPLAQAFNLIATNKKFSFIVNHLKSKACGGAAGADLDLLDGQACFNNRRKLQAAALLNFINTTVIPGSGSNHIVSVGDYNSYYEEDPMDMLRAGGFVTPGTSTEYSYLFGGALGSLDHAVLSGSLLSSLTSLAKWNTNSVEPSYLDYEDAVNDGGGDVVNPWAATYTVSPWRASDHDPIVMSLNLDITLALSLSNFNAVKLNNTSKLTWVTENEINNKSFIVERSIDNGLSWQVIATIAAAGNSNSVLTYSTIDASPVNGNNLYRLKIVSSDNQFSYSAIRKVSFSKKYSYTIYPNPVADQLQLSTDNAMGIRGRIQVLNSAGQVLLSRQFDQAGSTLTLDLSGLAPGLYLIKIMEKDGEMTVERFTKQ